MTWFNYICGTGLQRQDPLVLQKGEDVQSYGMWWVIYRGFIPLPSPPLPTSLTPTDLWSALKLFLSKRHVLVILSILLLTPHSFCSLTTPLPPSSSALHLPSFTTVNLSSIFCASFLFIVTNLFRLISLWWPQTWLSCFVFISSPLRSSSMSSSERRWFSEFETVEQLDASVNYYKTAFRQKCIPHGGHCTSVHSHLQYVLGCKM